MFKDYIGFILVGSLIFLVIVLSPISIVHVGFIVLVAMIALKDEINN